VSKYALTPTQRANITATIATYALDVDDELELLQMLGAIDSPEPAPTPTVTPANRLDYQRDYQERRRERQLATMRNGLHALSATRTMPDIPLHPDAPPPDDLGAPGPRCGTCLFREQTTHTKAFSGCTKHAPRAIYCMSSWPACAEYSPAPDADPSAHTITLDQLPEGWVATCSCGRYTSTTEPSETLAARCGRSHLNARYRMRATAQSEVV
jgi:hypothetical protein